MYDASTWYWWQYVAWVVVIIGGFELGDFIMRSLEKTAIPKIPINGPHHDTLGWTDIGYLVFNKLSTPLFLYHVVQFSVYCPEITWGVDNIPLLGLNLVLGVPFLFLLYDFFYCIFHRGLHHKSIYKYIHKHHHQQHAPTRGLTDAINTHPFEYVVGQWNHLWAIYLLSRVMPVHVLSILGFILIGAAMAGLNHTRLDLGISTLYQVKHHDAHHRFPNANFGQYVVVWDQLLGSFIESRESGGLKNSNTVNNQKKKGSKLS